MIQVVNKLTGEVYELADQKPEEIRDSWLLLSETIKACERAKDKLKPKVSELINDKGLYDFEDGRYIFRQTHTQRQNYDKSVMREVLDPDTFDLFLVPDKPKLDNYIKENLETLGDSATALRKSMVPVGTPYTTIRLEKISRKD